MPDFARGLKLETPEQIAQRFPFSRTHYGAPTASSVPSTVDLRGGRQPTRQRPVPAPECQYQGGSCVAFTLTIMRAALRVAAGAPFVRYSPAFEWYEGRLLEGTQGANDGMATSDGYKAMLLHGACPEPLAPYVWDQFAVAPTRAQLDAARPFRIGSWHNIAGADEARQALAANAPVAVTVRAYEDFERTGADGVIPAAALHETRDPNHEILVSYYDPYWFGGENWWTDRSQGYDWGQADGYWYAPWSAWDSFVYDASTASLKAVA